jgi:hypothetical protein
MRIVCLVTLLLLPGWAQSGVYKWLDEYGVVYSDLPVPGSERVQVPGIREPARRVPQESAPAVPSTAQRPVGEEDERYRSFAIDSPYADERIRSADGVVLIRLELDPELETSHCIALHLDGQPITEQLRRLEYNLSGVAQGVHTLTASVLDRHGETVLGSVEITFRVIRAAQSPSL